MTNDFRSPLDPRDVPRGWDKDLWGKLWAAANDMSREELIVFWLGTLAGTVSEHVFNEILEEMSTVSKEDLLDRLDEITADDAQKLI